VTTVLRRLIAKHGLEDDIAEAWLGAALGDQKLLKGRNPDAVFFRELLDRLDGPVPKPAPHDADKTLAELLGLVDRELGQSGDSRGRPKSPRPEQNILTN
jgi:hypothetical protein